MGGGFNLWDRGFILAKVFFFLLWKETSIGNLYFRWTVALLGRIISVDFYCLLGGGVKYIHVPHTWYCLFLSEFGKRCRVTCDFAMVWSNFKLNTGDWEGFEPPPLHTPPNTHLHPTPKLKKKIKNPYKFKKRPTLAAVIFDEG